MQLHKIYRHLAEEVDAMHFGSPVTHVYNPLKYAQKPFEKYLEKYGAGEKHAVLLGMNPGPYGMAQTGVPFGDTASVTDWLGIRETVKKPRLENPKRPIYGFDCPRSEVSGSRLWGWAKERFKKPESFFKHFIVLNYCPLVLMEQTGKNFTPDKLKAKEKKPLFDACDRALALAIEATGARHAIGIGNFAKQRLSAIQGQAEFSIGQILHPSPASPLANRGWARQAEEQLLEQGIDVFKM